MSFEHRLAVGGRRGLVVGAGRLGTVVVGGAVGGSRLAVGVAVRVEGEAALSEAAVGGPDDAVEGGVQSGALVVGAAVGGRGGVVGGAGAGHHTGVLKSLFCFVAALFVKKCG